jgi:hypothetical protein
MEKKDKQKSYGKLKSETMGNYGKYSKNYGNFH